VDLNKREYLILLILVIFTVILGINPSILLDGLNYAVSTLLYNLDYTLTTFDNDNQTEYNKVGLTKLAKLFYNIENLEIRTRIYINDEGLIMKREDISYNLRPKD